MSPGGQQLASSPNIWGRPVTVRHQPTNRYNSDVSTAHTIRLMRKLAREYASHQAVQEAVEEALAGGAATDREVAYAIFYWIRSTIQFVEDETLLYEELGVRPEELDKELLIVPPVMGLMPRPMGDCDDFSLLTASMLLAAGLRPFFVTVAADAQDPHKWSHIYICVYLADEGSFLKLDPGNRLPMVPAGWESSKVTRKGIWAI